MVTSDHEAAFSAFVNDPGAAALTPRKHTSHDGTMLVRAFPQVFLLQLLACSSPAIRSADPEPIEASLGVGEADDAPDTTGNDRIVPLFALIPMGPESARLLWVPWPLQDIDYRIERRSKPSDAWEPIDADVSVDSAVVNDLETDDQLRVVAYLDDQRLGQSVDLGFKPTSAPPQTVLGRDIVDGRGRGWNVGPDQVVGHGPMPRPSDLLVLPVRLGKASDIREVESVTPITTGWRAHTVAFELPPQPAIGQRSTVPVRGGATLNLSLDGIPRSALTGEGGLVGYCSTSGWGCLQLATAELEALAAQPRAKTTTDWLDFPLTLDLFSFEQDGLTFSATATGGVEVQIDYETEGLLVPTVSRIAARARPYAVGEVSATLNTSTDRVAVSEPLYTTPSVGVSIGLMASLTVDFDVSAVVDYQSEGPTNGGWVGQFGYARTFEVGYNEQFYGPLVLSDEPTLHVTPQFGDGSRGDLWFGYRTDANLHLNLVTFSLATASLSPTTGLVFVHDSTLAAPCNRTTSIAHAEVDLGAKLEASLDLPFTLLDRSFLLSDKRAPVLTWGNRRDLSSSPRLSSGAAPLSFRLRPRPLPPSLQDFIQVSGDIDPTDPSLLELYVDGAPRAATFAIDGGRFRVEPTAPLGVGQREVAVWVPDEDYSPAGLFGAPGQCVKSSVLVEAP